MDAKQLRLLTFGGIVALVVAVLVVVMKGDRSRDLVLKIEPVTGNDQITVYAGGAVPSPGLYTLPRGSRVASLIDRSGLLDTADTTSLHMAAELRDGQEVIVPERSTVALATNDTSIPTPKASPNGPINVNTAAAAELEQLSGIGPSLAQRIIDYRNAHGPFAAIEELVKVQGISARMVDDFRDQVTVGP